MPTSPAPPIDSEIIVEIGGKIALAASREIASGRIVFPPKIAADARYEHVVLPSEGRLWSWTVQRFRPKSPPYAGSDTFEPYAVGYVELDGALILETRLTDVAFDALHLGMPMRLVPLSFELAGGETRTTFAFAPMEGSAT